MMTGRQQQLGSFKLREMMVSMILESMIADMQESLIERWDNTDVRYLCFCESSLISRKSTKCQINDVNLLCKDIAVC